MTWRTVGLRNSRKTIAGASELRTTPKTGCAFGAPPRHSASSSTAWWRAAAPFALLSFFTLGLLAGNAQAQSLIQRTAKVAPPLTNPFADQQEAALAGKKLYRKNCSACHGVTGGGDAKHTPPLTTPFVKRADPGTLFMILKNGSENQSMPSFAHLPEPQRWQIIAYLQSL
jgi:mono/diheme cytochrome c family protein